MSVNSAHTTYIPGDREEEESAKDIEYSSDEFFKDEEARQQTWRTIQDQIKERLGLQRFGLWFKQTELMKLDEDEMVVGVPNVIVKQYLEQKYHSTVEATAEELMGSGLEVRFDVAPKLLRKMRKERNDEKEQEEANDPSPASTENVLPDRHTDTSEDQAQEPEFTFEKLVLTDANRLAFLAAQEIASRREAQFKFLLIMGEHGVGKTALLRAAHNKAQETRVCKRVHYCRGEKWCNEYYHALQNRKMSHFRRRHRQWDLLIVDGIHFLEGKPAAQEELLHTAKTIQESGGRMVFSTFGHPHDLKESKPSFLNLITGAFWVELTTPPCSERAEIACQLASQHNLNADSDVFELIAEDYGSTLRELNAAICSLAAAGSLQGLDTMGVYMAEQLLGRVRGAARKTAPSIDQICETVSDCFDVSMDQLKGRSRRRKVCRARQAAMFFARRMTDLSLSDVGRWFGGRTHSTVKHSVEQTEEKMEENTEFAHNIGKVRKRLDGA